MATSSRLLGITEYPYKNNDETLERSRPARGWFGRYTNPWPTWASPTFMLLYRWKKKYPHSKLVIPPEDELNRLLPVLKPKFLGQTDLDGKMALTWLGHATVLVEYDGSAILTDPCFEAACQTFQGISFSGEPATTPRFRPAPCKVADLPDNLHFVLISHNHFDHLDAPSCQALHRRYGQSLTWLVPEGNGNLMNQILGDGEKPAVIELQWWQSAAFKLTKMGKTGSSLWEIVSTPCQHWCMRSFLDKMTTLWTSWAVIGPSGRKFFFGGDTGYCSTFKEIGRDLGPFELAALPIGAYDPHEFLAAQHIDPAEAVQVHKDIGAKRSVAMHWGTFPFADDSLMGPKEELDEAVKVAKLAKDEFITLNHGESLII